MTMLIAVSWRQFFPALAAVDRLEEVKPVEELTPQPAELLAS